MKRKTNNSHFTLETRKIIENLLNEGKTITEISNVLNRDRSNIGREINKHKEMVFPSLFNKSHPCLKHHNCEVKSYECYLYCKMIEFNLCDKLNSSPHVCNSCKTKNGCRHVKYYYKASSANNEYLNSWSKDRKGLHYTKEELQILNTDFKNLVLNCKSIYHATIVINARGYNFKQVNIYKQIKRDQLDLKPCDLPRFRKVTKVLKDTSYKRKNVEGHTYENYIEFKNQNKNALESQIDTVEGIKENNAPVLLTFEIVKINFLFIFKIDSQTSQEVIKKLEYFKEVITEENFYKITEITLTDNGKEFNIIEELIKIAPKTNLFYCHPYSSFEKGSIENNHELIRRVIPKGVSLKCYTQNELNLLCSHINSLYRKSLDGKCPFDLIGLYIDINLLKKLGLEIIKPEEVTLIPELLGNKNINNIKKHLDEKEIAQANIVFK